MAKVQFILEAKEAQAVNAFLKIVDAQKKTVHGMRKMNSEAKKSSSILKRAFSSAARGGVGFLGSTLKSVANFTKTILTKAFQTAKRAVLGLGIAFGAAVYAFGKFEAAMRRATAVSEVTNEQFDKMSKMARAAAIRLNISAADAAKAFYFLGSAGLSAADQIKAFSSVATMAKAATIEMGMAAEMLVDTMKGFKIPFTETGRVTDVLAKAVTSSNMTFEQLGETLSMISGLAKQTNNSIEETVAVIATMADVGIKGSRAGTSLRRSMLNLAAPASTIQKELKKYGIAVYDTTGRIKPFIRLVGEMSEKLRGASEEQKNMAFKTIFGARAIVGQLAVFNKGKKALDAYTKSLIFSGGTSQKIADKQLNALSEQFGILRKQVTDVAIQLGKLFSPALRRLIEDLKRDVKSASDFFKENEVVIEVWAHKAVSAAIRVKNEFFSFMKFMKEDWREGITFALNSFLELLKAAFESAVILAIAGGKGIWEGVKEGLLGGRDRKIMAETLKRYKEKGGEFTWEKQKQLLITTSPVYDKIPTDKEKYLQIQKQVEREFLQRQTKSIIGESFGAAVDTFKEAIENIAKGVPAGLKEIRAERKAKAKALKGEQDLRQLFKLGKSMGDFAKSLIKPALSLGKPKPEKEDEGGPKTAFGKLASDMKLQAREARLLTAAPGAKYDYAQQTARNTRQQLRRQNELVLIGKKTLKALEKLARPVSGTQLQAANFS